MPARNVVVRVSMNIDNPKSKPWNTVSRPTNDGMLAMANLSVPADKWVPSQREIVEKVADTAERERKLYSKLTVAQLPEVAEMKEYIERQFEAVLTIEYDISKPKPTVTSAHLTNSGLQDLKLWLRATKKHIRDVSKYIQSRYSQTPVNQLRRPSSDRRHSTSSR